MRRFSVRYNWSSLALTTVSLLVMADRAFSGSITGVVKNQAGETVVGAMVMVTNVEKNLSITVISQEQGRYQAADLAPGKYSVHGFGAGLKSQEAATEIQGDRATTLPVTLNSPADPKTTVSMNEFAALMPDGEGKSIILSRCTECHLNRVQDILTIRKTRDGWKEMLEKVREHSGDAPAGLFFSSAMPQAQKDAVLDYLSEHFGPNVPPFDSSKLRKALVKGAAAKVVVTELKLPAGSRPHELLVDNNGVGWVAERGAVVLGRYDTHTLNYTRIPLPAGTKPGGAFALDPQGRIWIADDGNSRFIQFDPKTEKFTLYPYPEPSEGRPGLNVIRFHADGTVWATGLASNRILHLDPATKKVTAYRVPAGVAAKHNANPYGMAIDGNNVVWFAEETMGKVAKIDPKTEAITEYDLPSKPQPSPRRMATDAKGNIWVAEYGAGKLAMIAFRSAKITEYPTPTKFSGPYSVDVDQARNVIWVAEMMADQIARFDPSTKSWVEYPIPTRYSSIRRIDVDRSRPNRIWFSGFYTDTLGYIDIVQ